MCILVFAEWNLAAFRSDIRSVTSTIYTNLLLIVVFIVLLHINFKDRYFHFAFKAAAVIVFCISTLIIIIGSKFYQISLRKENPYPDITSFKNSSMGNNSRYNPSNKATNNLSSNSNKMNLLSYHYQTGTPMKPNPTLFSATYNSSYNGNIFSNSSNSNNSMNNSRTGNESQSHSSGSHKHTRNYVNSNNNGYNNNFSNNNYNNNSFSNNNYSNSNYNRLY